jgi:hypothetical protein
MNYFIIFLVLVIIFVLKIYTINENFETIAQIQQNKAKADAIDSGFDSGFYDTSAPETDEQKESRETNESKLAEKADYTKALNDYDVEYHDSAEKIAKEQQNAIGSNTVFVFDPNRLPEPGMIAINAPLVQNSPTYYYPGEYKYGAASYVPDYTESVLLSKTNNLINKKTTNTSTNLTYYDINSSLENETNLVVFEDT